MQATNEFGEPLLPSSHQLVDYIHQVLAQADHPVNVRQILDAIPKAIRPDAAVIQQPLEAEIRAGRVFEFGRYRGQQCYWNRSQAELAQAAIESGLQIARSRAEVLRMVSKLTCLKGFPRTSLDAVFQQLVAAGKVLKWPSYLGSRTSLFAVQTPDPRVYARRALTQLAKKLDLDEAELLAQTARAIEEDQQAKSHFTAKAVSTKTLNRPSAGLFGNRQAVASKSIGDCLYEALRDINPNFDDGDLVSVAELRHRLNFKIDKQTFDRQLIQLAEQSRVSLHPFDRPGLIAPDELEQYVVDGAGQYYNAVSARRKR